MIPSLDEIAAPYATILCDIWGVVHDGGQLLPGAAARLEAWKQAGKTIILVTNAPRPASTIRAGLDALGLARTLYDAVTSSGEAGIAALTDPPRAVGFLGTREDRADLVAHGVLLGEEYGEVACTGFPVPGERPEQYRDLLCGWAASGVVLHCLNPDREAIQCGRREACAGAIADLYEQLGGQVAWYGKPHPSIYAHALRLAGSPPLDRVLAVGDSLVTDMLGAARFGIDALFVSHGLHRGAPFPPDFSDRHGLGDWRPIAVVQDLG